MLEQTPQQAENVTLEGKEVKEIPAIPDRDELITKINAAGAILRMLILEAKKLPKEKGVEPHQDSVRSLALAQSHLQTGFMWLRRAVFAPDVF
jgi:hypothetical protein